MVNWLFEQFKSKLHDLRCYNKPYISIDIYLSFKLNPILVCSLTVCLPAYIIHSKVIQYTFLFYLNAFVERIIVKNLNNAYSQNRKRVKITMKDLM